MIAVCVKDPSKYYLELGKFTVGKKYNVEPYGVSSRVITDDLDDKVIIWYFAEHFTTIENYREHQIDKILPK
jgi:hypothetical protein